jgi:(1->4)-alpha-D-glucan 1-alpha-D-glucosylmutase
VRARLSLLSELPRDWERALHRWAQRNQRYKRDGWPDANAEYLLYQTLAGAWPIDSQRVAAYLAKAVKEAKVHTSWTEPGAGYDAAIGHFVTEILADQGFVADLEAFLAEHRLVELGRINSLAQLTLLLTCPGIPDLYQGTEVWDYSLVDPDNRRPVDYDARRRLLGRLAAAGPEAALAAADEGGPKIWLIHRLLQHRRGHPGGYGPDSGYQPLSAAGPKAAHVLAYARTGGLVVVVPRLLTGLTDWEGTTVALPEGRWLDLLSGAAVAGGAGAAGGEAVAGGATVTSEDVSVAGGDVSVADLLRRFPVAVLGREG